MKNFAEEDEQNISTEKLEACPKKQPIESVNQLVEFLQ